MNTTQRKETELLRIELNTIVSNKPGKNILKKKTNKKQKAEHVCPCQLIKKERGPIRTKRSQIDAQIYFESRSLFNYNLVQCLYLELILNVGIYLLIVLWYLELMFKWGHRRNFESTKSVSKRFSTFEIEFC